MLMLARGKGCGRRWETPRFLLFTSQRIGMTRVERDIAGRDRAREYRAVRGRFACFDGVRTHILGTFARFWPGSARSRGDLYLFGETFYDDDDDRPARG